MNDAVKGFLDGLDKAIEVLEMEDMTLKMAIIVLKGSKIACIEFMESENNNQQG